MSDEGPPPGESPSEAAIAERAAASGIDLSPSSVAALACHARAVLRGEDRLHLTTIRESRQFLERHLGESFEGAAILDPATDGTLLDLGSGNGYPGLAVAAARPGLQSVLAEASPKKARFLEAVVRECGFAAARVLARQVQRAADLGEVGPLSVLTTRASGDWARVVPRLAPAMAAGGNVLVWAGEAMESVRRRASWRRLSYVRRVALPGRDRSWVWQFKTIE